MERPSERLKGEGSSLGEVALPHALTFSLPRLVGTEGELFARGYLRGTLERLGLQVEEEAFSIPLDPLSLWRVGACLSLAALILSRFLARSHPFLASLLALLLIAFILSAGRLWRAIMERADLSPLPERKLSSNLLVRIPGGGKGPELFLMAHYDSKSQSISLPQRIVLLILAVVSCALLALEYGLSGAGLLSLNPLGVNIPLIIAIPAALILLTTRTRNRSPGALDNAAALGVLLAVAGELLESPPRHLRVRLLFTGAEELGLVGAWAFLRRHGRELSRHESYFLNLDGVGLRGALKFISPPFRKSPLSEALKRGAARARVRLKSFPLLVGLMTDHLPFASWGYPALSLICVSRKSRVVHTPLDKKELLTREGLQEAGRLVRETIEELDRACEKISNSP
ncbi:MAG: M28 family metallopeptidase [Nitrospinota bacterium]